MSLFLALKNLLDAVKSKDTQAILAALLALLNVAFGPQAMQVASDCTPEDAQSVIAELESCCKERCTAVGADPVGKLGDGTILKIILQILAIIGPFLAEPKPTA